MTIALFRFLALLVIAVRLLVLLLVARSPADADTIGTLTARQTPSSQNQIPPVSSSLLPFEPFLHLISRP